MWKGYNLRRICLSVFLVGLLIVIGGCTKYANEEELQALENQKQAALAAEQRIEELKLEKADLEQQIAAKERELSEAQRILNEVKK